CLALRSQLRRLRRQGDRLGYGGTSAERAQQNERFFLDSTIVNGVLKTVNGKIHPLLLHGWEFHPVTGFMLTRRAADDVRLGRSFFYREHKVIHWIRQFEKLQMRLQEELRLWTDGQSFLGRQRLKLLAVEGLDIRPLQL